MRGEGVVKSKGGGSGRELWREGEQWRGEGVVEGGGAHLELIIAWNGTSVGCLLIVDDDNKSSVGVCQCSLWV